MVMPMPSAEIPIGTHLKLTDYIPDDQRYSHITSITVDVWIDWVDTEPYNPRGFKVGWSGGGQTYSVLYPYDGYGSAWTPKWCTFTFSTNDFFSSAFLNDSVFVYTVDNMSYGWGSKYILKAMTYSPTTPTVRIKAFNNIWIQQDFPIYATVDAIEGPTDTYLIQSTKVSIAEGTSSTYTDLAYNYIPRCTLVPNQAYNVRAKVEIVGSTYYTAPVIGVMSNQLPVVTISKVGDNFIDSDYDTTVQYSIFLPTDGDPGWTFDSVTTFYKQTTETVWDSNVGDYIAAGRTIYGKEYDIYQTYIVEGDHTGKYSPLISNTVQYASTDSIPKVYCIYPISGICYGSVRLQWSYINERSKNQYGYDVDVSTDGQNWTSIANHVISRSQYCVYDSATANGYIWWRVRAYNWNNQPGSYAQAKYYYATKPNDPVITGISLIGFPEFSWTSDTQYMYQLRIFDNTGNLTYDTDILPGAETTYTLPLYLETGNYTAKLKTFTSQMLESNEASKEFSIRPGQGTVTVNAEHKEDGTHLTITSSSFTKYYILRDGKLIGVSYGGEYIDRYCSIGIVNYTIKGINLDKSYVDAKVSVDCTHAKTAVIDRNGIIYNINRSIDKPLQINRTTDHEFAAVTYLGYESPTYYMGTGIKREWNIDCIQKVPLGAPLFYRNPFGDCTWVIATNEKVKYNWHGFHEYSYTITEIDYTDEVDYA